MSKLEHLCLKAALQEILNLETEDIIQFHLALIQDSNPDKTSEKCVSFKQSLGVLLLQSEQNSGSGPDLGKTVLDSPDLSLVPETIFSNELQLLVQASLLKGLLGVVYVFEYTLGTRPLTILITRAYFSCRSESS